MTPERFADLRRVRKPGGMASLTLTEQDELLHELALENAALFSGIEECDRIVWWSSPGSPLPDNDPTLLVLDGFITRAYLEPGESIPAPFDAANVIWRLAAPEPWRLAAEPVSTEREAALERLVVQLAEAAEDAAHAGNSHYGHFDRQMTAGANCPACLERSEANAKVRAALASVASVMALPPRLAAPPQ